MRRRAGRKRKSGRRKACGRLASVRQPSPGEIAATMPHRKGLGEKASHEWAESELGRMVLRGELEEVHGNSGARYLTLWRSYAAAISAPRAIGVTAGGFNPCAECPGTSGEKKCICERHSDEWNAARTALVATGSSHCVDQVCLYDMPILRAEHWLLVLGLNVLAAHFGLVKRWAKGVSAK